jgi:hypothetical protein
MSSLLLSDTGARRGRVRVSRGGRRVVVPLAEYRAERSGAARRLAPGESRAGGAGTTDLTADLTADLAAAGDHAVAAHPADAREARPAVGGREGRSGAAGGVAREARSGDAGRVAREARRARPAGAPDDAPDGVRPLRLTRRGRVVVRLLAAAALLLVVGFGVLGDRTALAGQEPAGPVAERVVLPGETLWAIAGEVAPDADRRDTVAQIIDLNDLPSAEVTAGQRLAVPTSTR